jgi:ribosomal-protein-alanine N-acetyltransferase
VGYSCWVCEQGGRLVGHSVMSVAVGEAHVLNVCVDPAMQGLGIGRRLLDRVLNVARERNADTAYLEVRVSNERAIALYESVGFCEIGQRPGYYPHSHGREDARVYAKALV